MLHLVTSLNSNRVEQLQRTLGACAVAEIGLYLCGNLFGIAGNLIEGHRAGFHVTELKQNSEVRANQDLDRMERLLVGIIPLRKGACWPHGIFLVCTASSSPSLEICLLCGATIT